MSDNHDGYDRPAEFVDKDQAHAFRLELGTSHREKVVASFDVRDAYARARQQPFAANKPVRPPGGSTDPALSGWTNFHRTTTDRDLDAEKQDRLHDGQLFRLNRQARGEVMQQPARREYEHNNGAMFGRGPPPGRKDERPLDPVLNNPQNADAMAIAKALRFQGSYNDRGGRRCGPGVSTPSRHTAPNNMPAHFAPSGTPIRGGFSGRGRGGYAPSSVGRNGPGRPGSLNPHADIHAHQGTPDTRSYANNAGHGKAKPAIARAGNIPPMMDRANSTRSTATMASSSVASTSTGAIFSASRRPPTQVGKLATPEEFMAAAKQKGLLGSKHAPSASANVLDTKEKKEELKTNPNVKKGLVGSKYAT